MQIPLLFNVSKTNMTLEERKRYYDLISFDETGREKHRSRLAVMEEMNELGRV